MLDTQKRQIILLLHVSFVRFFHKFEGNQNKRKIKEEKTQQTFFAIEQSTHLYNIQRERERRRVFEADGTDINSMVF